MAVCLAAHQSYSASQFAAVRLLNPSDPSTLPTQLKVFRSLVEELSWGAGAVLRVRFVGEHPDHQKIQAWVEEGFSGLGVSFAFNPPENQIAHIRIQFVPSEGDWSWVGRDALQLKGSTLATMNLATVTQGNVLHQFGHAVGLLHEREFSPQPPDWDRSVLDPTLNGPPHLWTSSETQRNWVDVFNYNQFLSGDTFDADSLMHDVLPCVLFQPPCPAVPGPLPNGFSAGDWAALLKLYPPGSPPTVPAIAPDGYDELGPNPNPGPAAPQQLTIVEAPPPSEHLNRWVLGVSLSFGCLLILWICLGTYRRLRMRRKKIY